ncbi:MAG: NADPH-dependent oxidoreductase [Crenarchaeota archaeon]|nr:NADPH-dependent oxidoreductase [Thermoproteota archaeon]
MACCIEQIKKHVSIRRFTGEPIPDEDLGEILEAARRAPTGWNLQPLSITVVRSKEKLRQLADAVGGQEHVANAAAFLVFSVDYAKIVAAGEQIGVKVIPRLANLYEALIDVGIASGWAALAAESLGYGIVYVALYENPCAVAEIIRAPRYVIPAVGLAVGRPAEQPQPRRRQPLEAIVDYEEYGDPREKSRLVAETYGARAVKLFTYVFDSEGYYASASEALQRCLREHGFSLQ